MAVNLKELEIVHTKEDIKIDDRETPISRRHMLGLLGLSAVGAASIACKSAHTETSFAATPHVQGEQPTPFPTESTQKVTPVPTETKSPISERKRDPNSLQELAKNAGKSVGIPISGWWFNNPKWREIVRNEFDTGVIEYGLHWNEVEPERERLDFSIFDRLVKFGKDNGMKLRGHALLWGNQSFFPKWLVNGNFTAQEMESIIRSRISQIVTKYKGVIDEWVVVNEAYKAPLRVRKEDIFFDALGRDYVRIAFDEARKANPDATLIYNDTLNHSSTGLSFVQLNRDILRMLDNEGLIDDKFALGVQGHIRGENPVPRDVTDTLKSYGIRIMLTECDIDMSKVEGTTEERNVIQAERMTQFLEEVENSGACNDYTFWDIGDKNSWLVKGGSPNADPTMYDNDLNPKPARAAVQTFFSNIALIKGTLSTTQ